LARGNYLNHTQEEELVELASSLTIRSEGRNRGVSISIKNKAAFNSNRPPQLGCTCLLTLTGNQIECEDIAIHESCIKYEELAEILIAVAGAASVPIPLSEASISCHDIEDSSVEKISGITRVEMALENSWRKARRDLGNMYNRMQFMVVSAGMEESLRVIPFESSMPQSLKDETEAISHAIVSQRRFVGTWEGKLQIRRPEQNIKLCSPSRDSIQLWLLTTPSPLWDFVARRLPAFFLRIVLKGNANPTRSLTELYDGSGCERGDSETRDSPSQDQDRRYGSRNEDRARREGGRARGGGIERGRTGGGAPRPRRKPRNARRKSAIDNNRYRCPICAAAEGEVLDVCWRYNTKNIQYLKDVSQLLVTVRHRLSLT
jgi:hypothetical protein